MSEQASGGEALRALRRKFMFSNMLFVAIVLVVMSVVMVATTAHQRTSEVYDTLDRRMEMNLEQMGGRPSFNEWLAGERGQAPADGMPPSGQQRTHDQDRGGAFIATTVLLVDAEGSVVAVVEDPLGVSEDDMSASLAEAIASLDESNHLATGKISQQNLFFEAKEYASGTYEVAFVSGDYVDQSVYSLLRTLGVVCALALAAFFLMSLFLSRWALGPVRRAWDQQQQFIADASHELKTPLTVILANNSLLMSDPTATVGSQMQWIESTEAEAHLMQGLVNDMLYLARNDATAEQTMGTEPVDMSDLTRSAVLQFESVAFERGVLIEDDIDDGVVVRGDHANLQRLLGTLVDNACKYSNAGGSVSVKIRADGQSCRLDVHNTGAAIPAGDLPHIFDRFYRADKSRERSTGGYGLGLAIAQSIAEAHGGAIGVTSTEEAGTTFTVKLPLGA